MSEKKHSIASLVLDEVARRDAFPVSRGQIFVGHAGVTALPRSVADAAIDYTRKSSENHQEFGEVLRDITVTRRVCAEFIGAEAEEIALLGPTSLGLSLFANGIPWRSGDEILCYSDDYPANVYPWMALQELGVVIRYLQPDRPGEITPGLVEAALTERTRLVALASANFLTGYRIDVDAIGRLLNARGVLFSLDGIQTLGAFPLSVEYVDFMSADAHKWMLGPMAIGIVYVKKRHFSLLRPTLLGAWNVRSPNYITQDKITFPETAQRYEPGVLNISGIYGMKAAIEMMLAVGTEQIGERILALKARLVAGLERLGCSIIPPATGANVSGITTFWRDGTEMGALFKRMEEAHIIASLRFDRAQKEYIRISPHFYNTEAEIDQILAIIE